MRKSVRTSILWSVILLLTCTSVGAQDLPEIISIRELKLRPESNEIAFQNYYNKWCKDIRLHTKGVNAWIMKGDRGERAGLYNMVWGFNYMETRDYYFPVSDKTNYPKWNAALERFQFQAPEEPLVEDMTDYTDFIVVGYDQMLNPQLGEVISLSYPKVKAGLKKPRGIRSRGMNNALQNNIDGYYMYLLKGDRGEFKGRYAVLRVFDTYQRRSIYFPETPESLLRLYKKRSQRADLMTKFKSYFDTSPTDNNSDIGILY